MILKCIADYASVNGTPLLVNGNCYILLEKKYVRPSIEHANSIGQWYYKVTTENGNMLWVCEQYFDSV